MILLNDWPFWNFSEWHVNQTSAFWTALGAIGTVGTLWYAIRQGIKNSKKINDLAEVNKSIVNQNKLIVEQNTLIASQYELSYKAFKRSISPVLYISHKTNPTATTFFLCIRNLGELATITAVRTTNSDTLDGLNVTIPLKLYRDTHKEFQLQTTSDITNLTVKYIDGASHEYVQVFLIDRNGCRALEAVEIAKQDIQTKKDAESNSTP